MERGERKFPLNAYDRRLFIAEFAKVREPLLDDDGEPVLDDVGLPARKRSKAANIGVIGAANLHPEGIYSDLLGIGDLLRFVARWAEAVDVCGIGPEVKSTHAQQAFYSMRRYLADVERGRPKWHDHGQLYRFEYEAKSAAAPYHACRNGHYERLYHSTPNLSLIHI